MRIALLVFLISLNAFAVGNYVKLPPDPGGGGSSTWGSITGTLALQLDLQSALDGKWSTNNNIIMPANKCYYFAETGNDTGFCSPTDGRVDFYSNNTAQMSLVPSGELTLNIGLQSPYVQTPTLRDGTSTDVVYLNSRQLTSGPWTISGDQIAVFGDNVSNFVNDANYMTKDFYYNFAETNNSNYTHMEQNAGVKPTENSPNTLFTLVSHSIQLDPDSSGFQMGTSGEAVKMFNLGVSHSGTGNSGAVTLFSKSIGLGNGTDPITVKGYTDSILFGNIASGVTLDGPVQGFIFQTNSDATGVNTTNNFYGNIFSDNATFHTDVGPYTSFAANTLVDNVKNNTGFNAFHANQTVSKLTGNASYNAFTFSSTIGANGIGTGSINGFNANPNISNNVYYNGVYSSTANVTGGTKWAGYFDGDVNITGNLSFGGALSIGQLNAYASHNVSNGGGNPYSVHSLVSGINIPANDTTANADTIGVNTAALVSVGANAAPTLGPFGIMSSLALPTVVETHTGSVLPKLQGGVFALNFSGTSTGGTVNEAAAAWFALIPNGVTTVDVAINALLRNPFGNIGTVNYGIYQEDSERNYFEGTVESVGGLQNKTSGSQPTCDAAHRGMYWEVQGGPGVKDSTQVCHKDAANVYGWEIIN